MNLRLLSAERAAVAQHDFFCAIAFYALLCRRCYKGKRLVTSSFAVPNVESTRRRSRVSQAIKRYRFVSHCTSRDPITDRAVRARCTGSRSTMRLTVVPRLAVRLALRNQVARGRSRSSHVVVTFAESLDVCRDFTRSQRRRIVWSGEPPSWDVRQKARWHLNAFLIFLTVAWR